MAIGLKKLRNEQKYIYIYIQLLTLIARFLLKLYRVYMRIRKVFDTVRSCTDVDESQNNWLQLK